MTYFNILSPYSTEPGAQNKVKLITKNKEYESFCGLFYLFSYLFFTWSYTVALSHICFCSAASPSASVWLTGSLRATPASRSPTGGINCALNGFKSISTSINKQKQPETSKHAVHHWFFMRLWSNIWYTLIHTCCIVILFWSTREEIRIYCWDSVYLLCGEPICRLQSNIHDVFWSWCSWSFS